MLADAPTLAAGSPAKPDIVDVLSALGKTHPNHMVAGLVREGADIAFTVGNND